MSIFDVAIRALDGGPANLQQYRGRTVLVVNVASKCGLTPQYASLQRLYETYADRGFVVVGVPCNQFGMQEPGTAAQIRDFCEVNFGITFPIPEKVDVNGPGRHELFARLTAVPDADGVAGDVRWNFEKVLVSADGPVVARFRPLTDPLSPELVAAVERYLPQPSEAQPSVAQPSEPHQSGAQPAGPDQSVAQPLAQPAVAAPEPLGPLAQWPSLAEARWPTMPGQPSRSWSATP